MTEAGSEIAGYRIESVIGRGGMGVVYLADHLRLKRKVALKVLAPEPSADERFRDRPDLRRRRSGGAPVHRHALRAGNRPQGPLSKEGWEKTWYRYVAAEQGRSPIKAVSE